MAATRKLSIVPVCPDDLGSLNFEMGILRCRACGRSFPISGTIAELLPREIFENSSVENDQLNSYAASFSSRPDRWWYEPLRVVAGTLGRAYLYSWAGKNIDRLADGRPLTLLDAACGDGTLTRYVASRHSYVGTDFSSRLLDRAERHHPSTYFRADLNHLPFSSASFDLVVSLQALQYLHRPATALREMARVLKPDGRLLLTVPNKDSLKYRWKRVPQIQLQLFDHEAIDSLFSSNFKIESVETRGIWLPLPKIDLHAPGVYSAKLGLSWTIIAAPKM